MMHRFARLFQSFVKAYCDKIGTTIKSKFDHDDIDYIYNEKIKNMEKSYAYHDQWTETFWTSIKVNESSIRVGVHEVVQAK